MKSARQVKVTGPRRRKSESPSRPPRRRQRGWWGGEGSGRNLEELPFFFFFLPADIWVKGSTERKNPSDTSQLLTARLQQTAAHYGSEPGASLNRGGVWVRRRGEGRGRGGGEGGGGTQKGGIHNKDGCDFPSLDRRGGEPC